MITAKLNAKWGSSVMAHVVSDRTKVKCTKKKRRNAKQLTEKQKPWFDAATSSFNVEGKFASTFVSIR